VLQRRGQPISKEEKSMQNLAPGRRIGQLAAVLLLLGLFGSTGAGAQQPPATPGVSTAGHGRTVENWTSLSLAGSELVLEKPTLGGKADLPQFTRELIQVKWRRGDPIDLYIIRPKGVVKPPVVIYLYSYPSETDRFRDDDYCTRITQGGVAAVGFVSALTGQRYAMRPMKEWFVSELQEALGSSVHDVQMVINFLSTRDDLDVSKVGMFGTGSGGTIAILAAAADPRIKTIDVLNPWGDWPDWIAKSSLIPEAERPNYLKPDFLQKVAPLDPIQWLPQLTSPNIRIQRVLDDAVTPQAAEERMEAVAPQNAKLVHFGNARQLFGASSQGKIFQWVKDQIQPPAPTPSAAQSSQKSDVGAIKPNHDD
jgi:hypothetical protein